MKKIWTFLLFCVAVIFLAGCSTKQVEEGHQAQSLEDLKGEKIAVITGSPQDLALTKLCPESEIVRLPATPDILTAVSTGVTDYMALDTTNTNVLGIEEKHVCFKFCYTENYGFGMAFRKEDSALCAAFNTFLQQIQEDGTYEEVHKRWLLGNAHNEDMPIITLPEEGEVLRIGTVNSFPFCFIKNGEPAGFDLELMVRFAAYLNRPISFDFYEISNIIQALAAKKIDVIAATLSITEERKKKVLFSDPYVFTADAIYGRENADHNATAEFDNNNYWDNIKESFNNNFIKEDRWKMVVDGLGETVVITIFAILIGTLIGCIICWMSMSHYKLLQIIARIYVEILRDVPILVFLMLMFYVVFAHSTLTATWVAIIAFGMNFGAFTSVMFQTGIKGVSLGQREAGMALGFSKTGTFFNFILPQAMCNIIPVFKNEAVSLLKNTSIVGYIAIQDLTKVSDIIRSRTFDAFFPLISVSIVYFILAWLMGKGLNLLIREKRVSG